MTITANDPFKAAPRISRDEFRRRINMHAAPGVIAERDASAYWDAIVESGVDPLFILAMFNHESTMGKYGMARTTHSWGNTRPPSFGVPHLRIENNFSVYRDWLDGVKSTVARLVSPDWVYHGRSSIREIFIHPSGQVWAPAGDNNNPNGYLNAVIRDMNAWADGGQPMPDKRVPEPPFIRTHRSPNKDGYDQPRRIRAIVDHISGGPLASNLSWLTNPNSGASSNVLIAKNGDIYLLVDPSSSPWTNGPMQKPNTAKAIIREWFEKKINPNTQTFTIEHEGHDTDVLTAAQITSSAWVHAWVAETYGVPLNRDYVLGHYEIDSVGRSYCPSFSEQEWNAIIDGAKRLMDGGNQPSPQPADEWPKVPPAVPDPRKDNPLGAFWIPKAFITPMAVTPLSVSGYVMSPAFAWTNPEGEVLIVQYTERQRYELHQDGSVTLGRLGAEALDRKP